MTKRVLPRLEGVALPWRADRPAAETVLPMPDGPPSWIVALDLLRQFVTAEEATRLQEDFAELIEIKRRNARLARPPQTATMILSQDVIEWLEAVWLGELDPQRGIPDVRRWKRRSIRGD